MSLSPYMLDVIVFCAAYRLQVLAREWVAVRPNSATGRAIDPMTTWETP